MLTRLVRLRSLSPPVVRSAFIRHFHKLILPNKDQSTLVNLLHKDKSIPFNITRDLIGIPIQSPSQQEQLYDVWQDYFLSSDTTILSTQIDQDEEFWIKSIKIPIQNPVLFPYLINILTDNDLYWKLKIPKDYPEKLISMLYYHDNIHYADFLVNQLVSSKVNLNWDLLLKLSLVSETHMKLLLKLYENSPCKKKPFAIFLKSLRSLNVNQLYINKFSKELISKFGLSDIPSNYLNYNLKLSLIYNLNQVSTLLKTISIQEKPSNWLSKETGLLFAKYITLLPIEKQLESLNAILIQFDDQILDKSFWKFLFKRSKIDINELLKFSKHTYSVNELTVFKSKKFLSSNNQKEFWNLVNQEHVKNDDKLMVELSLDILIMKIRNSNNLKKSYEFVKFLLLNNNNEKYQNELLIKSFILGSAKLIKSKRLFHRVRIMDKFENFLIENNFLETYLQNYFIYFDLEVKRFSSVLRRLDILSNSSSNKKLLSPYTIENLVCKILENLKHFSKNESFKSLEKDNDTSQEYQILQLIINLQNHSNKEINPKTWGILLNYIIETFKFQKFCSFLIQFLKVSNYSEIDINSSNDKHPLRIIISDQLIRKIIHKGFIQNPTDPWIGLKFIKELEKNGIFISRSVLQGHLLKYVKILHNYPNIRTKWRNYSFNIPIKDVSGTVKEINEIFRS